MPAILIQILRMLAGFGGAAAATRFLGPVAGKAIGRLAPRLLQPGKLGNVAKKVGEGALFFGGFEAGGVATDVVTDLALGTQAGEPPLDDTVDDAQRRMGQAMPFEREQSAGLQRAFDEAQVREALELMGVDFNEFSELAGSRSGGLV